MAIYSNLLVVKKVVVKPFAWLFEHELISSGHRRGLHEPSVPKVAKGVKIKVHTGLTLAHQHKRD